MSNEEGVFKNYLLLKANNNDKRKNLKSKDAY